jgi:hypothetical protein
MMLSGNGTITNETHTVHQGHALRMTCSTLHNATYVKWYKTESTQGSKQVEQMTTFLYDGQCYVNPSPAASQEGLNCTCISGREYECTILVVVIPDRGDTWRCQAGINGQIYNSNNLTIGVNGRGIKQIKFSK